MDFSFIETKTLLLIVHLIGISFGAGGAFISDLMFFKAIRDGRITKSELGFLNLGSLAVAFGLTLLVFSGLWMFSLDPERYSESTKFLAKMTVVGVLIANGVLLHNVQIPYLKAMAHQRISTRKGFTPVRFLFLFSGVVSLVSWVTALVLGAFRAVPWSYASIITLYCAVLAVGFIVGFIFRQVLVPTTKQVY